MSSVHHGTVSVANSGGVVLESSADSHSCGQVKWNFKKLLVYVLIFTVTMTSMWWLPFFFFLDQNWNEWVSEKLPSFGICCLHAPLILHHWGPSVIMNKPVNRIFQSSCGVLLSVWTVCQRRGCQLPSLTEREVAPDTVENSDDPIGSSRSQCLSAAWFLLTFSGGIYTIHHNSQVFFFYREQKKTTLTN